MAPLPSSGFSIQLPVLSLAPPTSSHQHHSLESQLFQSKPKSFAGTLPFFGEALLQAFQLLFASFQLCSWIFSILQLECLCQAFQLAKCFVALSFQMFFLEPPLALLLALPSNILQVCFHPFKVLVIQSLPTHLLASLCQAFMAHFSRWETSVSK